MCNCRKPPKHADSTSTVLTELKPEQWGPVVWKMLHISAERIGRSTHPILEADSANSIQLIISGLPDVLPCVDCQNHARTYLQDNKFLAKDLSGSALRTYVRNYLFTFHNAVRARKGQPVLIETPEACAALYETMNITAEDDKRLADYFRYALLYRIVNSTKYMRWWDIFRRLRLMLGY
jgi:hypothetical protein